MAGNNSLRDKLVVLVGGSGFLGRHLAQELLARGARLRIASRHSDRAYAIKALGNLGQVQFAKVDVTRPERLAALMTGADAVVNLVGAFTGDLDKVQGKGAGVVAAAAAAAGAQAFVQVSAIGADAGSAVAYARTKGEGEAAVRAAFPKATVIRPSAIVGPDDNFINLFGGLMSLPILPVFAPQAEFQPLLVADAAAGIVAALADPATHGGRTYEIGGPERLTMLELNHRIAAATGKSPLLVLMPDAVSGAIAALTGWLPGAPLTRSKWQLMKVGSVTSGCLPGLAELGVTPLPLSLYLDRWMVRFRAHGRFTALERNA